MKRNRYRNKRPWRKLRFFVEVAINIIFGILMFGLLLAGVYFVGALAASLYWSF